MSDARGARTPREGRGRRARAGGEEARPWGGGGGFGSRAACLSELGGDEEDVLRLRRARRAHHARLDVLVVHQAAHGSPEGWAERVGGK